MAPSASGFFGALATDLLADVLFAAILAAAAIWLTHRARRKRVRRFFGVMPGAGSISVYLSSIVVKERGTVGIGPIVEGYHGPAITELEYRHVLGFAATVETKPFIRLLRAVLPDDLVWSGRAHGLPDPGQPAPTGRRASVPAPRRPRQGRRQRARRRLRGAGRRLGPQPAHPRRASTIRPPTTAPGPGSGSSAPATPHRPPDAASRSPTCIRERTSGSCAPTQLELDHPGPINEYFIVEKLHAAHGRTISSVPDLQLGYRGRTGPAHRVARAGAPVR